MSNEPGFDFISPARVDVTGFLKTAQTRSNPLNHIPTCSASVDLGFFLGSRRVSCFSLLARTQESLHRASMAAVQEKLQQEVKLFNRWSFDDVEVRLLILDISPSFPCFGSTINKVWSFCKKDFVEDLGHFRSYLILVLDILLT